MVVVLIGMLGPLTFQIQALVPGRYGFLGILVELLIRRRVTYLNPRGARGEHQVGAFGWCRQIGINSRGEGVYKLRPTRIP